MRVITSVSLILLGVLLGLGGATANARIAAQPAPAIQSPQLIQPGQPVGTIITSEDIGYQLIAAPKAGDVATGKLMIRVNGRWLPAVAPTGVYPAR